MERRARPVRLIASPYHDGLENVDRGRGPTRLLDAARESGLGRPVGPAAVETVPPVDPSRPEAARVFELNRRLAEHVRAALTEGAFPLILAGDCNSAIGTVAGCGSEGLGVVWFDAHADFDTPEDSVSGSLDAMGLAMLVGRGWRALRQDVPGLTPVDERRVVLAAVRAVTPGEAERLRRSHIRVLPGNGFAAGELRSALDELQESVRRVYLHVDLDSLDPSEGVANQYAAPGGVTTTQLVEAIADVAARFEIAAAAVTAYHPDFDTDGRAATAAARVLAAIADGGSRP